MLLITFTMFATPPQPYLQACGNTFAAVNPELLPKVSLSASSISFPPCHPGEAVHQVLCLTNHGDTPVHFAFKPRAGSASKGAAASSLVVATANGAETAADSSNSSSSSGGAAKAGLVAAGGAWFDWFAVLPVQGVLEPKSQQLVSCTHWYIWGSHAKAAVLGGAVCLCTIQLQRPAVRRGCQVPRLCQPSTTQTWHTR
jgi:hypothetical protein